MRDPDRNVIELHQRGGRRASTRALVADGASARDSKREGRVKSSLTIP